MKNCVFKPNVNTIEWLNAAGVRAVKTMAQTALGTIGASAVISAVDWRVGLSASVISGGVSILTSITGSPEVSADENNGSIASQRQHRLADSQG